MCALLHLLICTALRAHIIVVEALYKINYYYYYYKKGSYNFATPLIGLHGTSVIHSRQPEVMPCLHPWSDSVGPPSSTTGSYALFTPLIWLRGISFIHNRKLCIVYILDLTPWDLLHPQPTTGSYAFVYTLDLTPWDLHHPQPEVMPCLHPWSDSVGSPSSTTGSYALSTPLVRLHGTFLIHNRKLCLASSQAIQLLLSSAYRHFPLSDGYSSEWK